MRRLLQQVRHHPCETVGRSPNAIAARACGAPTRPPQVTHKLTLQLKDRLCSSRGQISAAGILKRISRPVARLATAVRHRSERFLVAEGLRVRVSQVQRHLIAD